jgi:hypothetical protein
MKRVLFSFIFSISISIAYSQNIKGKIYDALTKEPITGASIKVTETDKTFRTNNEGVFSIPNSGRKLSVQISAIG